MRKKVFSLLAVVLFMGSSFAVNFEDTTACQYLAAELHENLMAQGVPHSVSYKISGMALEACEAAQS